MKKAVRYLVFFTILCMLLTLGACAGGEPATTEPNETKAQVGTGAGSYHFEYVDEYGDTTKFSIKLRENGTFTVMTSVGPLGDNTCNGDQWAINDDGTITTGATDKVLELSFVEADGTIHWSAPDEQGNVTPIGYTAPTEFLEKPVEGGDEEVYIPGVYTFTESGLAPFDTYWTIILYEDGTYLLTSENERQGVVEYPGSSYSIDGPTLTLGSYEGTPDIFTWSDPSGFTVTTGSHTFAPEGSTLGEEPMEAVTYVPPVSTGTYKYTESGLAPFDTYWTIVLNQDGTYLLISENERQGAVEYQGSSYSIDGPTLTLGSYEGTPDIFTWSDPSGFTVTTGSTTFAPEDGTLSEEPAAAVPAGIPLG